MTDQQTLILPVKTIDEIVNYLANLPYKEVAPLIADLHNSIQQYNSVGNRDDQEQQLSDEG